MTLASSEQSKRTPWFAQAGAACSIIPVSRAVSATDFALKPGGYCTFFKLTGMDEEGLTDQEIESFTRTLEGAFRGLPEGACCLYQFTRVRSGCNVPRQEKYDHPVTESFVRDRLEFLKETADLRRIDLHWCLTFEPAQASGLSRKPKAEAKASAKLLSNLQKSATILVSHLSSIIGLEELRKEQAFQFLSYLFNLEDWAEEDHLRSDTGVDRQIVKSTVRWHEDHLKVGKRHVQMFFLQSPPEASRPCLFSGLASLDCDSILCTSWRPKSNTAARKEIDQQEKFISFFKVGVLSRLMAGKDTASLDSGAAAKAANSSVDDLTEVIRSLDKKGQGEFSARLLISARTAEEVHDAVPSVHRIFVDARAQVMEETLGNLSAFFAMFPGNHKYNVFPLWMGEDHHARLSSVFAPHLGHPTCEDLSDLEYLNVLETRSGTPFYQDVYVGGVRVMLILGPPGTGKTQLMMQILRQIRQRGESAIVYDPACEYIQQFYDVQRGDIVLNPLDERCPYWGPAQEMKSNAEADAIAASLYSPATDSRDEFFHQTPAQIFAHLLKKGPSPQQLAEWLADGDKLEKLVEGTEMSFYIDRKAGPQRAGVLASLGLVAKSFRLLPTKEQGRGTWNARTWAEERQGWIFITSRPPERETLRPLHSLWIDTLVIRLLTEPRPGQKKVWFVIDELASFQKLPQLHTAITENRKSGNPLVLGFQGKAQLEVIYGHLAETMLSSPASKIYMKTAEPKAAEWIQKRSARLRSSG